MHLCLILSKSPVTQVVIYIGQKRDFFCHFFPCSLWFIGPYCTPVAEVVFLLLLLYRGYIVTFTKVLTMYHSWIYLLHQPFLPHSWSSFIRSPFSIYIGVFTVFTPYSPSHTLSSPPPPPTPTTSPERTYSPIL
jgi:hypothetical protein